MAVMDVPLLFDKQRLKAHRARALGRTGRDGGFLRQLAVDDLMERIADTTRTFSAAIELGGGAGLARRVEEGAVPQVTSMRATDLVAGAGIDLVCDPETLPLASHSADLIAAPLSLHWTNDLPGALVQIRQALQPDGLFIANLFGVDTLNELRDALRDAELALTGGVGLRISPFLDAPTGVNLLGRAGFALPVVDQQHVRVRYSALDRLFADLRDAGETAAFREAPPPLRRAAIGAALHALQKGAVDDGSVEITFHLITLTGWAPADNQPKPARRGSATTRLADALKTTERSAGEKAGR